MPTTLGELISLTLLDLSYNQLTSSVPSEIAGLSQLTLLALQSNNVTGVFPLELCSLSFRYISLGGNQMSCIPWCQDDYDWGSVVASLPRCQDFQDGALSDLQESLGLYSSLQTQASLQIESSTIESVHPFPMTSSYLKAVDDEYAFEYVIEVTFYDLNFGHLLFCADPLCSSVIGKYGSWNKGYDHYYGWSDTKASSLTVKRPTFYISFQLDTYACPYVNDNNMCTAAFGFKLALTSRLHRPLGWIFMSSPPYLSLQSPSQVTAYATDMCQPSWHGITCEKGLVTSLTLSGFGLQGTMPTSIGVLVGLTSLDLSSNRIEGSIASSIVKLPKLNSLNLNLNNFMGNLPSQLSNSSSLYVISLANNRITGSVPTLIYSASRLQYMYLDGNDLIGEVSGSLCDAVLERNAMLSLTHNTRLTCYQDMCSGALANSSIKLDVSMRTCAPTSSPTVSPTTVPSVTPTALPSSRPTPTHSPTRSPSSSPTTVIVKPLLSTSEVVALSTCLSVFGLVVLTCFVHREWFSETAKTRKGKQRRLQELPIHRTVTNLRNESEAELLTIIDLNISTALHRDADGRTALEIILFEKKRVSHNVVHRLLLESLPFNVTTGEEVKDVDRVGGWTQAIQSNDDNVIAAVQRVLIDHKRHILLLSNACDNAGRKCRDIASQRCKDVMYRIIYLHERYELYDGAPEHRSATSVVVFAIDHGDVQELGLLTRNVALKFMRHREQFEKEVSNRRMGSLDCSFVIPILHFYDDNSTAFREDAIAKGYSDYPFCFVMEAGTCNLKRVIDQQYIAGNAWHIIRAMVDQLATCLRHLHNKRLVHGDLKPLNVLQTQVRLKLIDFDASVKVGDPIGVKYSSCYLPPEMVIVGSEGKHSIRVATVTDADNSSYELLSAMTSFDIWGLGCVMFLLCTGSMLFPGNVEDNIVEDSFLEDLYEWSDSLKERKLSMVTNRTARNLLSLLLNKEPEKRPSVDRVLSHPFLTGMLPTRLPGEKAEWDVFISYRVDSDEYHAEVLYEECKKKGLKVWLDSKCLQAGQNWLVEFSKALVGSSVVICILSRGAINHRTKESQNWEKLRKESPCDNVLLEWRLAMEAKKRGMLEAILPVMVGDMDTNAVYNNYMRSGCGPTSVADVAVESVESSLRESLEREGLGQPFEENVPAKAVHEAILSNQAMFVDGDLQACVSTVVAEVSQIKARMIDRNSQRYKTSLRGDTEFSAMQARLQVKALKNMTEENRSLKAEIRRLKEEFSRKL